MTTRLNAFIRTWQNAVEWKLLLFLILFLDVKLSIKLSAILLIYFLQPNFRFGFKFTHSRLPLFYGAVIIIAVFNWLLYADFTLAYNAIIFLAISFWVACILAIHQVKLFVEKTDLHILHNTLLLFFVLNIVASALNLGAIFWEIGIRNPFHYQGQYQKYFINTGDHIKGITFDSSTTNAIINCFGIVYFLFRKKYFLAIACMGILILTASNFANMILLLVFAWMLIFKSTREQKSIIAVCILMLVIFLARFSPQNEKYIKGISEKYVLKKGKNETNAIQVIPIRERPDSLLDDESRKEKIAVLYLDSLERSALKVQAAWISIKEKPAIQGDSIHTPAYQWKRDTTTLQRNIISFLKDRNVSVDKLKNKYDETKPGKMLAFRESVNYLRENPSKILTGAGAGNFSSKLAMRATGLKIAGSYPEDLVYAYEDYLENHFSLYSFFFTKNASSHSILNSPSSVYDQLFTEYGLAGLAAFLGLYLYFFLKRLPRWGYGMPMMFIMLAAFSVEYWFEQLSVIVLFELMMFIQGKEGLKPDVYG